MILFVISTLVFWRVVVGVLVLVFWICKIVFGSGKWLLDASRARSTRVGTAVRCPTGHVIETHGDVYQCDRCSFVYTGSIFVCENVECGAVTPFIECQQCQLSVRNPFRWGH